jgi:hypothetical protein
MRELWSRQRGGKRLRCSFPEQSVVQLRDVSTDAAVLSGSLTDL